MNSPIMTLHQHFSNPAEAETRRGNFDIKLRLSEKW